MKVTSWTCDVGRASNESGKICGRPAVVCGKLDLLVEIHIGKNVHNVCLECAGKPLKELLVLLCSPGTEVKSCRSMEG